MKNKKDIRYYIRRGNGKEPVGAIAISLSYRTTGISEEVQLSSLGYVQVSKSIYDNFIKEMNEL